MGTQTGEQDEQVFLRSRVSNRRKDSKPKRKQAPSPAASKSTMKMETMIAATTCHVSDRILWRPGALTSLSS
eukprot:2749071-Pyramimonas_sp.AAC.1